MQEQLQLKEKFIVACRQLMTNCNSDIYGFDSRLTGLEEEWVILEKIFVSTQHVLHHAQMKLMPSRQALQELLVWLEMMQNIVDSNACLFSSLSDIDIILKKYQVGAYDIMFTSLLCNSVGCSFLLLFVICMIVKMLKFL